MNVPYLVKILNTESLQEVVANIELPALDMNLAIWEAIDRGEIAVDENEIVEVDGEKHQGSIRLLKDPEPSSDPELKNKLLRVIQHYTREETNVTRGRLNSYVKDPASGQGYPWHEYLMAVQHLIDGELVVQDVIEVPPKHKTVVGKKGKKKEVLVRPPHKFAFLGLADNADKNEEWNAAAVNKWIADMEAASVK